MGSKYLKTKKLQARIEESKKYFSGEKYNTCLSLAEQYLKQGNHSACEELLNRLPTKDVLLERLVSRLKGKSVYKTLKQIHENKDMDNLTKIKGLSSLLTHCIIEMQNGNKEFGILLPILLEKENELIYNL